MHRWIVGIDEAGRGPLAGPVAVGVVKVPHDFDWSLILGVGDSKKISHKNREAIFMRAKALQKEGLLVFHVSLVAATFIDRHGITKAVGHGIFQSIQKVAADPQETFVKLDGLLKAPPEYVFQETIIKGDAKEKVIGLASIMAKVTRDRYMEKLGKKPEVAVYDFAVHKGYGTKAHREAILKHGILTGTHRKSFCKNLVNS